jgi:hypothetical protein
VPNAPVLTADQRATALAKAAVARTVRAELRAELKAGRISLAQLLRTAESNEFVASMRVTALLDALPGYGKAKAATLLAELGIADSRRVRGLGPHQRAALLDRIGG